MLDVVHHTDEGALGVGVLDQSSILVDAINTVRSGIAYKRKKEAENRG